MKRQIKKQSLWEKETGAFTPIKAFFLLLGAVSLMGVCIALIVR